MNRQEQLINETRKRMQQLYEYSFYNDMNEEGEQGGDPNAAGGAPAGDPNAMGGDPNAMGGDPNAMGGDPNAMGGDPNAMGGDPNAMGGGPNAMGGAQGAGQEAPNAGMPDDGGMGGDPNAMGGDPSMMGGDPNAMGDPSMMGDPNAMGDPSMGGQPGPNDDVVDITSLTDAQTQMQQSQEEQGEQLSDIDSKFSNLMKVMDKFTQALDASDQKIADLKKELVKRNPTEEETMNVRLNAGGNPFDQKPEEFWRKFKDINNHYNITSNNDAPQNQTYDIKYGDINGFNDHLVDDSFDAIPGSLREYFRK